MTKLTVAAIAAFGAGGVAVARPVSVARVDGPVGARLAACMSNAVCRVDAEALARVFEGKSEKRYWQTEFWGKWMLGAVPLAALTGDGALVAKRDRSAEIILAAQRADGYLGNYRDESHLAYWDVWGRKYVMQGLMRQFDATGDRRFLDAAARACDHLMGEVGPQRTAIHAAGSFRGMAAMSVLEAVMELHARTHERKYLDFARYVVEEMDNAEDGPALVGRAGVDVADRWPRPENWWGRDQGAKAYEMMSCYIAMLAYARATGDARAREAVLKTAENIRATEINLAGSGASFECWYHGRRKQARPAFDMMETCVTVTWLRLAGALLEETGDPRWADEFEKTFYNAYLASLSAHGDMFSKYCPLAGPRVAGGFQCRLPINCCMANGPRGFVALLDHLARVDAEGAVCLDVYAPAAFRTDAGGTKVCFTVETDYPRDGRVVVRVDPERPAAFTLKLRVPGWADGGGRYRVETRTWRKGDAVTLDFAMPLRMVEFDRHVAFLRGPLLLARDPRFGDGNIHACVVPPKGCDGLDDLTAKLVATPVRVEWPSLVAVTVPMRLGLDLSAPRTQTPRAIGLCDFASAAGDWSDASDCRVWLEYPIDEQEPDWTTVTNTRTKATLRMPRPNHHAAYGAHPKQTVDVWTPREVYTACPLAVYIHGGAWVNGEPLDVVVGEHVAELLGRGVAVASVGYRLLRDLPGEKTPIEAIVADAAAAIRFLRERAAEWGLDATRVGLVGGSAGACTSLSLALADDNALGVRIVAAAYPQTSLDPREMRAWVPGIAYGGHAFGCKDFDEFLARRDELLPQIERFSPAALAQRIAPAKAPEIVIEYWPGSYPVRPGEQMKDPTHSAQFGIAFEKLCAARGLRCTLHKGPCREPWRRLAEALLADKP